MSPSQRWPESGPGGPDSGWLTGLLEAEARRYAPDGRRLRAAVQERVDGGRHREPARRRPSRAVSVVAVAALAAAAVFAVVETRTGPAGQPPAGAGRSQPAASQAEAAGPYGPSDGGVAQSASGVRPLPKPRPTPSLTPSLPAPGPGAGAGLLSASGSNNLGDFPYWLQEEVSVSLRAPVTALQLTVTVARSPQVASTGYWTTDDPAVFDVTVTAAASTLTYSFILKPGQTLPAGNSTFAVQFNHGTNPHDPAADGYALQVTSQQQDAAVEGTAAGSF